MSTADNFDALWASLKEQVKAAREQGNDREGINTDGYDWTQQGYGGRVCVSDVDEDGASMHISSKSHTITINCQPDDLRAIAAQCLAAAEEIEEALEEAQAVRPNTYEPLDRITIRSTK